MMTSTFDLICACGECGVDPDSWECESARDEVAKVKASVALAEIAKTCRDCKVKIEYLADFPGPRCLSCHAKKMEGKPLERPDFAKTINIGKRR